jgi:mannitol-1-phosphate 5-dehydrogenase
MEKIQQNKLVLFGAGKIGRSFIAQLFSRSGYEVVFIDINNAVIDALNQKRQYKVIIKSDKEEIMNIVNVRGVHTSESNKVILEIATAGIVAISVGLDGLENIFPLLAKGLIKRQAIDKRYALDIIIAENMRDADVYFSQKLKKLLPEDYLLNKLVGLVETSIGKMVPIMPKKELQDDILQIFAEPYNTLILNKKGFRNPIPRIEGLAPKDNMKAWVDRKLFIHNLGHSAAAYFGYMHNHQFVYLYESLAVTEINTFVRETMLQAAQILMLKYPGEFTINQLSEHIDDLLLRFQNKALGDTIFRVGCDLNRKLGSQDRLAGAIKTASSLNLPYDKILYALVCGCHFRATDEEGKMFYSDTEFVKLYQYGIKCIMSHICGFDEIADNKILVEADLIDQQISNLGNRNLIDKFGKLP